MEAQSTELMSRSIPDIFFKHKLSNTSISTASWSVVSSRSPPKFRNYKCRVWNLRNLSSFCRIVSNGFAGKHYFYSISRLLSDTNVYPYNFKSSQKNNFNRSTHQALALHWITAALVVTAAAVADCTCVACTLLAPVLVLHQYQFFLFK